ncbi:MAG: 1-deoxy-D-xylulose-5-phosphate synthase [Myxococcales bacterium]|nr:MAG: 1-deoxy-D-xylulose-5-phosphate synthase [Myxococcales bacterium]
MSVRLLDGIRDPKDLKRLPLEQLPRLAQEIRDEILQTVSRTGGHLASNLGVVELTIALHYVFETPADRIVWDVGHQGYPHKLLTGRLARFSTLRQHEGVSGFLRRAESEYDAFGAGHAATSISAALGIAEALRHKGDPSRVIAVIGDGGMTSGLALEGLNNAGDKEKDLIVVFNHNAMSIDGNVGALSAWFSNKLTGSRYRRVRAEIKRALSSFPTMGPEMIKVIRRVMESTKVLLTPGILFEGFNFQYVGPVDGHDVDSMVEIFRRVRQMEGPILVHVVTEKGKGYPLAERDPERFHGVSPFDLATGRPAAARGGPPTWTQVFGDAMLRLAAKHKHVVAITAAMCSGTGLKSFAQTFPERFYDVGIAESHAVTFAAGLAAEGLKPVVAIYSTFLQRAFDSIIHDAALQSLPVVLAIDRGGLVGADGPTHHGAFDLSYLRLIPNIVIAAPKDEAELRDLLLTGVLHDGPFAVRYPRGQGEGVPIGEEMTPIPVGLGECLFEPDAPAKAAFLAIGARVWPAVRAAKRLTEAGIPTRVVNARFVKPLDGELIRRAVAGVEAAFSVEDNALHGGFGAAVLEWCCDHGVKLRKFRRLGLPDSFIPHGSTKLLLQQLGLDEDGLVAAVREMFPA